MVNIGFLFLVSTLTIVVAIENCTVVDTEAALNNHNNSQEISMENINEELKRIIRQSIMKKYETSDKALDLILAMNLELNKRHNISQTIERVPYHMIQISTLYDEFVDFVQSINATTDIVILNEYFQKIANLSEWISNTLEELSFWSIGQDVFSLVDEYIRDFNRGFCDRSRLTQGHIWNFYNILFGTEYKGSLMLVTAYRVLTISNIGDFRNDIQKVQKDALKRILKYSEEARKAMENAPREIVKCDDGEYVKNQTYVELQGISQGFLIDPSLIEESNLCDVLTPQKDLCYDDNELCLYARCAEQGGRVEDCRDVTEGQSEIEKLSMCPAEDHTKRYSWLTVDTKTFGNYTPGPSTCSKPLINRQLRILHKANHGEVTIQDKLCFCDCKRTKWNPDDIRAISFAWTEADFTENRVITDIKFEETNGIIQLRAQQGRLIFGGRIDESTLSWIETPNAIPSRNGAASSPSYSFINKDKDGLTEWLSDRDFKYISTGLSMNLDDIVGPQTYVVVGVAFQKVSGEDPNRIELKIRAMKFDYLTGTLNPEIVELSAENKTSRQYLDLGSPGNPVKMKERKNVLSKSHQVVQFQQTNWKKDLGQSIVPFFDMRPVEPVLALPLSGVGLYHRGCEDCGGFVALKLITYDISKHFWKD